MLPKAGKAVQSARAPVEGLRREASPRGPVPGGFLPLVAVQ